MKLREFIEHETETRKPDFLQRVRNGWVCPECRNGTHEHKTGIYKSPGHSRYYCGKCCKAYSIIDLWMLHTGETDFKTALKSYCEHYGIDLSEIEFTGAIHRAKPMPRKPEIRLKPENDFTQFYKDAYSNLMSDIGRDAHEYLHKRKISDKTIRRFCLGFSMLTTHPHQPLIIPTSRTTYTARSIPINGAKDDRQYRKIGHISAFNLIALRASQPIFIAEGELNAMSFYELGCASIGTGTANNISNFCADVIKRKDVITQPLILALDPDSIGQEAEQRIHKTLNENGIKCHRLVELDPTFYTNTKQDINSLLQMEDDADSLFWRIQAIKAKATA